MLNKNKNNNRKKDEEKEKDTEQDGQQDIVKDEAKALEEEAVVLKKPEFEELKSQAQKSKEHWDRLLRQQADFENMRKRLERERIEFVKFANEELIVDLLGILDDLERSVDAAEKKQENFEAFLKGIEMILAHLYDFLKKRGVVSVEAKGRKFDPNQQEALMQTETDEYQDGEVIEELQKGYKLNDKIIRTAKVRVAKRPQKN